MDMNYFLIFFFLVYIMVVLFTASIKLYGAFLGFQKKWYLGLIALFVPFFGLAVGFSKLVLKKDILK